MSKLIKILLFFAGSLVVLTIAAIVLVPMLVDVEKYKPLITEKLTEATGRTVQLNGELKLSLFPWVGVSFSDLTLGNPEGFEAEHFVKVESFEAHVKVVPLLSREVQINRFVVSRPEIYLEKREDGTANWQGLGSGQPQSAGKTETPPQEQSGEMMLKSIEIGEFAIVDARLVFNDRSQRVTQEVRDLTLRFSDVSLERPLGIDFKATVDGQPIAVFGKVGPLGPDPGNGTIPLDLTLSGPADFNMNVTGQLVEPATDVSYELSLKMQRFSPREFAKALAMAFPLQTTDPQALNSLGFTINVSGGVDNVRIADSMLTLDDSTFKFAGAADTFTPLQLSMTGELDAIDLDRYLPPPPDNGETTDDEASSSTSGENDAEGINYQPLRELVVDISLTAGDLRVKGGKVEDIVVHLRGKDGLFTVDPFSLKLYGGSVMSKATLNVQEVKPKTAVQLTTEGIQAEPLLKDFAGKDILQGMFSSEIALQMQGDTPDEIKQSLNGEGELLFQDGAVVGIDLAGMVRNVQSSFGMEQQTTERPKTDFAELRAPFTVTDGLVQTPGTSLKSPLIRVNTVGSANLVSEILDLRVRPKFVATLKGQGDTAERTGVLIPVLVEGTFAAPEFSPDLESIVQDQLQNQMQDQLPDQEELTESLKKQLDPEKVLPKESAESVDKAIKGLLPKFNFN